MEEVKCCETETEKEDGRDKSATAADDDKPVSVHGFVFFFYYLKFF